MRVDLNGLSEEELVQLNHQVVARLRLLRQARYHMNMMEFRIGERVCFQPSGRSLKIGTLTRYNKKTVTVITEDGEHWTVGATHLRKYSGEYSGPGLRTKEVDDDLFSQPGNVITLK